MYTSSSLYVIEVVGSNRNQGNTWTEGTESLYMYLSFSNSLGGQKMLQCANEKSQFGSWAFVCGRRDRGWVCWEEYIAERERRLLISQSIKRSFAENELTRNATQGGKPQGWWTGQTNNNGTPWWPWSIKGDGKLGSWLQSGWQTYARCFPI